MRVLSKMFVVAILGFALMFVGHFAAFLAAEYAGRLHLPYWWSYLLLYPVLAVTVVRRSFLPPLAASVAACLAPGTYFLALGFLESTWTISSTAIIGFACAFLLAAISAVWVDRRNRTDAST